MPDTPQRTKPSYLETPDGIFSTQAPSPVEEPWRERQQPPKEPDNGPP